MVVGTISAIAAVSLASKIAKKICVIVKESDEVWESVETNYIWMKVTMYALCKLNKDYMKGKAKKYKSEDDQLMTEWFSTVKDAKRDAQDFERRFEDIQEYPKWMYISSRSKLNKEITSFCKDVNELLVAGFLREMKEHEYSGRALKKLKRALKERTSEELSLKDALDEVQQLKERTSEELSLKDALDEIQQYVKKIHGMLQWIYIFLCIGVLFCFGNFHWIYICICIGVLFCCALEEYALKELQRQERTPEECVLKGALDEMKQDVKKIHGKLHWIYKFFICIGVLFCFAKFHWIYVFICIGVLFCIRVLV